VLIGNEGAIRVVVCEGRIYVLGVVWACLLMWGAGGGGAGGVVWGE